MNKRVMLVAGATAGAVALVAAAIFAGVNIVNAATHGGRTFGMNLGQRGGPQQIQPPPDQKGVVVVAVEQGSPADLAGVSRGDILLQIDSKVISQTADLSDYLRSISSTATVSLDITRGGTAKTLSATLIDRNGKAFLGIEVFGARGMDRSPWGMGAGAHFGMPISGTHALVTQVVTDSPASAAGIVAGDTIIAVDGKDLAAGKTLASAISAHGAGDKVTLTIQHKGATTTSDVTVTLAANPDTTKTGAYLGVQYVMGGPRGGRGFMPGPGMPMPFGRTAPKQMPQGAPGAIVRSVATGSPAETAGLKRGDLITALDGTVVTSAQSLVADIATHKPGETVTLSVQHQGATGSSDIKVTLGDNPSKAGTAYLGVSVSGGPMIQRPNGNQPGPRFNNPGLRRFFGNGQPGNGNGQPGNGAGNNQNTRPLPGNTL